MIPQFEYDEPSSIQETVDILAEHGDRARLLAGGTDLIIMMRRGRISPKHVISLWGVPGLDSLRGNGETTIGALTTHRTIEQWVAVRHPAMLSLVEAAKVVGGHQVRNVATIGGNLCNASPAADTPPPLLCLDAQVHLAGPNGTRVVSLNQFFLGPGQTVRAVDEVLTEIVIPPLPPSTASAFLKAGRRKAMEISVVNVAARITLENGSLVCRDARIALGAVAPTPIRAPAAEDLLRGEPMEARVIHEAGRRAVADARPISDVRASADYRRMLIATLVERAIWKCVERVRHESEGG
jgi:CO/xanthine dehydrogenase FAD-binding subunit